MNLRFCWLCCEKLPGHLSGQDRAAHAVVALLCPSHSHSRGPAGSAPTFQMTQQEAEDLAGGPPQEVHWGQSFTCDLGGGL